MTTFKVGDTVGFTHGPDTVWGTVHWIPRDGSVVGVTAPGGGRFSPSPLSVVPKTQAHA